MQLRKRAAWGAGLPLVLLLALGIDTEAAVAQQARRVALVLGTEVDSKTAVDDRSNAVAALLRVLGFDVTTLLDLPRSDLLGQIDQFGNVARSSSAALVYYAGRGAFAAGELFLLPAGDSTPREERGVDLGRITRALEGGAGVRILLLESDFPSATRPTAPATEFILRETRTGTVMALAFPPGSAASEEVRSRGLFTQALLRHLGMPGLDLDIMLQRVKDDVVSASGGAQQPLVTSGLISVFHLRPVPTVRVPEQRSRVVEPPEPPRRVRPSGEPSGGGSREAAPRSSAGGAGDSGAGGGGGGGGGGRGRFSPGAF